MCAPWFLITVAEEETSKLRRSGLEPVGFVVNSDDWERLCASMGKWAISVPTPESGPMLDGLPVFRSSDVLSGSVKVIAGVRE